VPPRRKAPFRRPPVRATVVPAAPVVERPVPTVARIDTHARDARADLLPGSRVTVVGGRYAGQEVEILSVRRTAAGLVVADVRPDDGPVRLSRAVDLGRSAGAGAPDSSRSA
jgi:hypothetical protein